jgi:hypothetical protein
MFDAIIPTVSRDALSDLAKDYPSDVEDEHDSMSRMTAEEQYYDRKIISYLPYPGILNTLVFANLCSS